MKRGFTIIEISIVVVIVGLLIGGILIGVSIMESARVNAQVRQLQKFDIAISNFRGSYHYLPGDMPNATDHFGAVVGSCTTVAGTGTQTCDGDGDGKIDYVNTDDSTLESWRAWEHLSHANLLDVEYTGIQGTSCTYGSTCIEPDINVPQAAMGEDLGISLFSFPAATAAWAINTEQTVYAIGHKTNTSNAAWQGRWWGQGLTPSQAIALDIKMDNGDPISGRVVHMNGGAYSPNCTGGDYTDPTEYDTDYEDLACILMITAELKYD